MSEHVSRASKRPDAVDVAAHAVFITIHFLLPVSALEALPNPRPPEGRGGAQGWPFPCAT